MNADEIALVGFLALFMFTAIYCTIAIILMRRKLSFGKRGIGRRFEYH